MRNSKQRFAVREQRVRINLKKNSLRVRLSVFKSGRHIYAQLIDDKQGITLASASSLDKNLKENNKSSNNLNMAAKVGKMLGERSLQAGIKQVVFDKGGYKYHGVIKALADSAREHLEF